VRFSIVDASVLAVIRRNWGEPIVPTWDLTDIKTFVDIIQAIMVSIAAVVGGLWGWRRFWILGEEKKARVDLEKAQYDVAVLQRSMLQRGTLNLTLAAKTIEDPVGVPYLAVTGEAKNVGNRSETLDWTKGRLLTARIVREADGKVAYDPWVETKLRVGQNEGEKVEVTPGETSCFLFIVPVDSPGIYRICLNVPCSSAEAAEALKTSGASGGDKAVDWAVETIAVVMKGKPATQVSS
jgi:hypothetical protein